MAQNNKATQTPKANPAGSFSMRMGSTTYITVSYTHLIRCRAEEIIKYELIYC